MNHSHDVSVDAGFDSLDYSYAAHNSSSAEKNLKSEKSLWCAVIEQAFVDIGLIDIKGQNQPMRQNAARDEALRWLLRDKKDFIQVCLLAGVSPGVIREAAKRFALRQLQ